MYPSRHDTKTSAAIKAWRRSSHLTQSEAANALSVPLGTLQKWEHNDQQPRGLAAIALRVFLFGTRSKSSLRS